MLDDYELRMHDKHCKNGSPFPSNLVDTVPAHANPMSLNVTVTSIHSGAKGEEGIDRQVSALCYYHGMCAVNERFHFHPPDGWAAGEGEKEMEQWEPKDDDSALRKLLSGA